MSKPLEVGDRVKYSREFCRSTGCYTGEIPFAKGIIMSVEKFGYHWVLATVDWKNENLPSKVNVENLVRVGDVELV